VLLGLLYPFADSFGIFAGFAEAKANIPIVITDNNQGPDAKASATFDHLRDAADLNHRLFQV
jgi:hypothetical protein